MRLMCGTRWFLLLVAIGVCAVAATASATAGSTAREAPPPGYLFDGVPHEPPAPPYVPPPVPGPGTVPQPPVEVKPEITLKEPEVGETWYDGDTVTVSWNQVGPIAWVKVYYEGERCKLGGQDRGRFDGLIGGEKISDKTSVTWKVPWLDGTSLVLHVVGFDDAGKRLTEAERKVRLLPRELKTKLAPTCVAVVKRVQRLYYFVDGETKLMHIVSTAAPGYLTPNMRPGSYDRRYGQMGRVFDKLERPKSRQYQVYMPWWLAITSSGSHGLHATSPNLYDRLGSPASHGCVRQHYNDARNLYSVVRVGTPVYVF
jgi:hypothetical protein